jgi:3'-phosphoadenosine 5'-phosphosulfate sulfotransferase (PAPS reductase)/FAD synthetase
VSPDYVIFASYGNDSVALIQWAHEQGLRGVTVAYSNTGWAAQKWAERVRVGSAWAQSLGFQTVEIPSIGMYGLVRFKKAWPRGGGGKYQFCTEHLKEAPALEWLGKVDPAADSICMIGVRREESDNRATFPEWTEISEKHSGRSLHAPLVRHREAERNALILKSPLPILPHRSKECYPCVNARKGEIAAMDEPAIVKVETMEEEAGINSRGNARVMFSPARHNGAIGIRAVIEDAKHGMDDLYQPAGCDGGWCGS